MAVLSDATTADGWVVWTVARVVDWKVEKMAVELVVKKAAMWVGGRVVRMAAHLVAKLATKRVGLWVDSTVEYLVVHWVAKMAEMSAAHLAA